IELRFFFASKRRHTRFSRDWSSDVCSSDLVGTLLDLADARAHLVTRRFACVLPVEFDADQRLRGQPADEAVPPPLRELAAVVDEIGRASCRERVGSMEIRSSVKNKKTETE